MKLCNVSVEKLFGIYTYNITLFVKNNVTIIDAPNGMGKTTILKLIKATVEGDIMALDTVPFKNFQLTFDNQEKINISKNDIYKSDFDINVLTLRNRMMHGGKDENVLKNIGFQINDKWYPIAIREELILMLSRRYGYRGRGVDESEEITFRNYIEGDMKNECFDADELFEELNIFSKSLNIFYISANRLYQEPKSLRLHALQNSERREPVSSVMLYQREIKEKILSAGKRYADESEKLDRTFPKRVLEGIIAKETKTVFNMKQIDEKLVDMEKRRNELGELGLITEMDESKISIPNTNNTSEEIQIFLSNYIEDNIAKLDIYKELAEKLNMLQRIINIRNGFSDKEMKFNAKEGVVFKLKNGRDIPISKLSSGEKNDFVLFYELIFKCSAHSLILVDEPEISLHVSWQQEFADELIDICTLRGMQGIVATHSPNIVNNHWDLLVDLEDDHHGNS